MTQRSFIEKREGEWRELERVIANPALLRKKAPPAETAAGTVEAAAAPRAAWFPQACRKLAGDLNTAKSHGFDPALIERLNRLTMEGNQLLYGGEPFSWRIFSRFIFQTFPRAVRSQWRSFWACFLIFFGLALFSALICLRFPGFVYELMSRRTAASLEALYNPRGDHFLKPREVSTDADMFGYYVYNNITIAFRAFAGGILAGIGSVLILAFNGIFAGAAAAHLINKGYQETFFSFIVGHSGFELTALVLAAQGGLLLGYRLFITRGLSRGESLREAGKTALPIISGSALMLVIAACIEAFWSSRHEISQAVHYGAGLGMIVLLIVYFLGSGGKP
ncbi:MAG: stage II sporulation protein M [Treponema sp.]|jgi:uncharacterized membrane protein SpoIIM required for sporulation|nr:stage II sporulation protein M [Treponema sp.]